MCPLVSCKLHHPRLEIQIIFRRHQAVFGPAGLNTAGATLICQDPVEQGRHSNLATTATMLFRFGVILTPESSDVEVFVVGSRVEMGHWDLSRAVRMSAARKLVSPQEPCLWVGDVDLAEPFRDALWVKFVKRVGGTDIWEGRPPPTVCAHTRAMCGSASREIRKYFPRVGLVLCNCSFVPHDGGKVPRSPHGSHVGTLKRTPRCYLSEVHLFCSDNVYGV